MNCFRCEGLAVIDRRVVEDMKQALAELTVELIEHAQKNKIDHRTLTVLPKVAANIRILESIK